MRRVLLDADLSRGRHQPKLGQDLDLVEVKVVVFGQLQSSIRLPEAPLEGPRKSQKIGPVADF
jgi:hypothetical protein